MELSIYHQYPKMYRISARICGNNLIIFLTVTPGITYNCILVQDVAVILLQKLGCLVLCWMPFFIILPIEGLVRPNVVVDKLLTIFFWLGYCNSAMNPLIYAYSSREFRRAYKGLLQCNIRKMNKRENLEKLSRLNNQNLTNRSYQFTNKNSKKSKFQLKSIYEENLI